jgi:hypothetical protein
LYQSKSDFPSPLKSAGTGTPPAEREANPRTARLGREKGNEDIFWIHDAGSLIAYENLHAIAELAPANRHFASGFERRVYRVVQDVDQELFNLRRIGGDLKDGPFHQRYGHPSLEANHPPNELSKIDLFLLRWRKAGEAGIRLHEAAERFRTGCDHVQAAARVIAPIDRWRIAPERSR